MDKQCCKSYLKVVLNGVKETSQSNKDFGKCHNEDSDIGWFIKVDL